MSEKILISRCLVGENVRFDGRNKLLAHPVLARWLEEDRLVTICPEIAGGLGVPREPCEIIAGDGNGVIKFQAQVISKSGVNHSENFIRGAREALSLIQQHAIKMAIFKKNSPSCGNHHIYDGSFSGKTIDGAGVAAALLKQAGVVVFNETELDEAIKYFATL